MKTFIKDGVELISDYELTMLGYDIPDYIYERITGNIEGLPYYNLSQFYHIFQYYLFDLKLKKYNLDRNKNYVINDHIIIKSQIYFCVLMPGYVPFETLLFEAYGNKLKTTPYYIKIENEAYISLSLFELYFELKVDHIFEKHRVFKKEKIKDNSLFDCKKYKTYIMYDSTFKAYKIGKSINPNAREKTLGAQFPRIALFAVCDENIETHIHRKYKSKRIRGEWFDLNNNDLKEIISLGFKII